MQNDSINNNLWLLGCEIVCKKQKYVLYGLYKSPECTDKDFLVHFDKMCDNFEYNKTNILLGDFNIDLMNDSCYPKLLKKHIADSGMKQFINKPTRITENSRTLIDLVMSNNYNIKAKMVLDNKISDHNNIEIILNDFLI